MQSVDHIFVLNHQYSQYLDDFYSPLTGTSEVEIRLEVTDSGQRFPRSLGDTVLQTFLTARSGTQTPSMRRKFGDQNKIQKTISECTEWLQKLCRLGCDLYEIKPGCVILVFKCQKRGLNFLWPGVTSGRFSRELTAIFQNSYSEMGPGVCQIDVGFNCIDMCATHNESNSATTSSGKLITMMIKITRDLLLFFEIYHRQALG